MSNEFWVISIGALVLTPLVYFAVSETPGLSLFLIVALIAVSFIIRLARRQVVPLHAVVVRNGILEARSGARYWPSPADRIIQIRPDSETLRSAAGRPVFLSWRPSEEHILHYIAQFPAARKQLVETVQALLEVRSDPSIEYLNERFSEQFGVTFLTVEGPPPEAEPPKKKTAKERREQAFQDFMDETGTYSKWIVLGEEYIKQHPEDFPDENSKNVFRGKLKDFVYAHETGQRT